MATVKINELKHIVLEGGGAKGAAYLGAIQAIEAQLKNSAAIANPDAESPKAILDYGNYSNGEFKPQIETVAGSSAGAITSFAIALGLNSEQIKEALEYEFINFLEDHDDGKYRMCSHDGRLKIGEDNRKRLMGMGDGIEDYEFPLAAKQKVKTSTAKKHLRAFIVDFFISSLFDGMVGKLKSVGEKEAVALFFSNSYEKINAALGEFPQDVVEAIKEFKKMMDDSLLAKITWKAAWKIYLGLFKEEIRDQNPSLKFISKDSISNFVFDNGMFSGFAVREFFFELMLVAATEDTHFSRNLFSPEKRAKLKDFRFKIGKGRKSVHWDKLDLELQQILQNLANINFETFKVLTGIDLTICASNFTTDHPLYFSPFWTPKMNVLEAVGASMSIPPAIKPVYNAANVYMRPEFEGKMELLYALEKKSLRKTAFLKNSIFDANNFNLDRLAIIKYLTAKNKVNIDPNTSFGIASFLPLLRLELKELEQNPARSLETVVDGEVVQLSFLQLAYHYNAAYKGLLLDGGYRCNIPYNILRYQAPYTQSAVTEKLEGVLAIKLDNTFPNDWLQGVYKHLTAPIEGVGKYTQVRTLGKLMRVKIKQIVHELKSPEPQISKFIDFNDIDGFNKESFERLAAASKSILKNMKKENLRPWNKRSWPIQLMTEGYAYGSEDGQIRYLSDHEHIIPLYSYGIGTYDFDMEPFRPLVDLAVKKAKEKVAHYFA